MSWAFSFSNSSYIYFPCMDSIRDSFRCVLFIPLGIAFVAYKRPPWAPKGPKGPEGPLGPNAQRAEGPFGPLGPLALGPLYRALGPPLGPPRLLGRRETALRENCAASKLRCEETALRANGSAGARSVQEYNLIRPKAPRGMLF